MTESFKNAQKLAYEHPETFQAPSYDELKKIKVGDFVKICIFLERFWIEVTEVNEEGITGIIENDLLYTKIHGYKYKDKVQVKLENIYDIDSV